MSQHECVIVLTEIDGRKLVHLTHFDTEILLVDVTSKRPVAWGGASKTDSKLINTVFAIYGLENYKAKSDNSVLDVFLEKKRLDNGSFAERGKFLKAMNFQRFIRNVDAMRV